MSAPRVVALASHHGLNVTDTGHEKDLIHYDPNDHVNPPFDANMNTKTLNSEHYKSLQVNRSNTTTGYIAGVKTQVQLSQNLQNPTINSHLTNNGYTIMANGAATALAAAKQSYADEGAIESARLKRDPSDNNMGRVRV